MQPYNTKSKLFLFNCYAGMIALWHSTLWQFENSEANSQFQILNHFIFCYFMTYDTRNFWGDFPISDFELRFLVFSIRFFKLLTPNWRPHPAQLVGARMSTYAQWSLQLSLRLPFLVLNWSLAGSWPAVSWPLGNLTLATMLHVMTKHRDRGPNTNIISLYAQTGCPMGLR